ncbi:ankyrin repeat domain-containing protein [Parashewanella tropica]|uniref:ankyrin repeat domain-containing protein n=1 Tax=Parashewanella tropica TaxID=2547970 RepID=UPI00105977D4|nr:ankyrin repeat domain-containing protein [Parashewanella tropica]
MSTSQIETPQSKIGEWEFVTDDGGESTTVDIERSLVENINGLSLQATRLEKDLEQLAELWRQYALKEVPSSTYVYLNTAFSQLVNAGVEHQYELQLKGQYVSQLVYLLMDDHIPAESKQACLISMSRLIKVSPNRVPDFRCHVAYLRCTKHNLHSAYTSAETKAIETINRIFGAQFPDFDKANLPACTAIYGLQISECNNETDTSSPLTEIQQEFYLQLVTIFYTPFYLARQFGNEQAPVLSALLTNTPHNDEMLLLAAPCQLAIVLCHVDVKSTSLSSIQILDSDQTLVTFDSLFFAIQTEEPQLNHQLCGSISPSLMPQQMPLPLLLSLQDSVTEQISDYEMAKQWAGYLNEYWVSTEHQWIKAYCATMLGKQLQRCHDHDSLVPFEMTQEDQDLPTLMGTLSTKIQRLKVELPGEQTIKQSSTLSELFEKIQANQKIGLPLDNPHHSQAIASHLDTLSPQCACDNQTVIAFASLLDEHQAPLSLKEAFIDYVCRALSHQKTMVHSAAELINYQHTVDEFSQLAIFSDTEHELQPLFFERGAINQLSVSEVNALPNEWLELHYDDPKGMQILLVLSLKLPSKPLQDLVLSLSKRTPIISWKDVLAAIDDSHWLEAKPKFVQALSLIKDEENSVLIFAIISGTRVALLKSWLEQSLLNIEQRDAVGNTPLHHVCLQGKQQVLTLLLEHSSNPLSNNQINPTGDTPLHIATLYQHLECVQALLNNKDTDAGAVNSLTGETPLHYAVKKQNEALITLFINHDAALLEVQNNEGYSPIAQAIKWHPDSFSVLMAHPKFNPNVAVYKQQSTIAFTLNLRKDELCCHLLQKFSELQLNDRYLLHIGVHCPNAYALLLPKLSTEINQLHPRGSAPLHLAAASGNTSVIQLLLRAGANRQVLTLERQNALFFAFHSEHPIAALEVLLTQGVMIKSPDFTPLSLLKHAVTFDNAQGLQYLIETPLLRTAFIQAVLSDGNELNLLHCAIEDDAYACVKYLASSEILSLNIGISKGEHTGLTPLMLAAKLNKGHAVKALCEVCPEAYLTANKQGYAAAHIAVIHSSIEALQALITVNDTCLKGMATAKGVHFHLTPLQLAAHLDRAEAVEAILVWAPDSITQIDKRGFSIAHIATESSAHNVLKILPKDWFDYAVEKEPYEGYTCLHLAVELSCINSQHLETLALLTQLGATIDKATTRINYTNKSGWRWQASSTRLAPITLCAVHDNLQAAKILILAGSKPLSLLSKEDWEFLIYDYARKYVDERYPLDKTNKKYLLKTIVGD